MNKCKCRLLEKFSADPDMPIRFDSRLNEFTLETRTNGQLSMYYCFACGGALPDSKRGDLFEIIDEGEHAKALKAKDEIRTVADMKRILGEPDWATDSPAQDPLKAKIYGAQDSVRQYTYFSTWRTVMVFIHEQSNGELVFTITANWKDKPKL